MANDDTTEPARLTAHAAYVLEGEHVCHECGRTVPVFSLMVAGPFVTDGDVFLDDDDDSALLNQPTRLPQALADAVAALSGGSFRPDFSKTVADTYCMNHCRDCGAKIGDWFVRKPGEAFFPTTDIEIAKLRGQRVEGPFTFDEPDLSMSSWTTSWLNLFEGQR